MIAWSVALLSVLLCSAAALTAGYRIAANRSRRRQIAIRREAARVLETTTLHYQTALECAHDVIRDLRRDVSHRDGLIKDYRSIIASLHEEVHSKRLGPSLAELRAMADKAHA